VRRHRHLRVPQDLRVGSLMLGRWVAQQRKQYREGRLRKARQRALEAIRGWTWSPPRGRPLKRPS
jgi:hypothetical protein